MVTWRCHSRRNAGTETSTCGVPTFLRAFEKSRKRDETLKKESMLDSITTVLINSPCTCARRVSCTSGGAEAKGPGRRLSSKSIESSALPSTEAVTTISGSCRKNFAQTQHRVHRVNAPSAWPTAIEHASRGIMQSFCHACSHKTLCTKCVLNVDNCAT